LLAATQCAKCLHTPCNSPCVVSLFFDADTGAIMYTPMRGAECFAPDQVDSGGRLTGWQANTYGSDEKFLQATDLGPREPRRNPHGQCCEWAVLWEAGIFAAGFLPVIGDAIDVYDCLNGSKLACGALLIPVVSARAAIVVGDLGQAGARGTPTSALDDLARACRTNSFVPGTEVLMADGSTKPIAEGELGDWVRAGDPETGESGPRQVVDLIVGDGEKQLVDIYTDSGGGTLIATEGHPFWVDDQGRWIDAGELGPGDRLLLVDGTTVAVSEIRDRTAVQRVHNLTIAGIHTYYVEVGDSPVLVHNAKGCLSPNQMNQVIRKGNAPRGIVRVDIGKVKGEQTHAVFGRGSGAPSFNIDGTWKHGFVDLTRDQRNWLIENGWSL